MKNRGNILYSKSFRKWINYTPAIAENRYSQSRLASCISIYGIYDWRQAKTQFSFDEKPPMVA